jgi:hypothetical protein
LTYSKAQIDVRNPFISCRQRNFFGEDDSLFQNSCEGLEVEGGEQEGRAEGSGDGGKEGTSLKHNAQKIMSAQGPTLKQENVGGEGEEAGGSILYTRKSKLNGHSDSIMELLAEIQTDMKAKFEKIEQVLVSHTRGIEQVLASQSSQIRAITETKAAVHDAQVAIEVVRQMATCPPSSSASSGPSFASSRSVAPPEPVEPKEMQEPAPSITASTHKWTHGNAGEGGDKRMASGRGTGNYSLPTTPEENIAIHATPRISQYSTRKRLGTEDGETPVNTSDSASLTQRTLTLEKKEAFEQDAKDLENAIQNLRETRVGLTSHRLQADFQSTPGRSVGVDLRALMPVYISESGGRTSESKFTPGGVDLI